LLKRYVTFSGDQLPVLVNARPDRIYRVASPFECLSFSVHSQSQTFGAFEMLQPCRQPEGDSSWDPRLKSFDKVVVYTYGQRSETNRNYSQVETVARPFKQIL